MPRRSRLLLCALALFLWRLSPAGAAAQTPRIMTESGLRMFHFAVPEGPVTLSIPDDVGPDEQFSGTVEGPKGYVLTLDTQRVRTGQRLRWRSPAESGGSGNRAAVVMVLHDAAGTERGRAPLSFAAHDDREQSFRFPSLIQAGRPFPIRGPFDGDLGTTTVDVSGRRALPLAESVRKVIVRAAGGTAGPVRCAIKEARTRASATVRSLTIDVAAGDAPASRSITIAGLGDVGQDVPLLIGSDFFYVRATEVPSNGTFSFTRPFRGDASLVIPHSRRDEVAIIVRTPPRVGHVNVRRQRGEDLRALDFDGFAAASELLGDFALGHDAAEAMLAADETRGLTHIFRSIPRAALTIQMLGFTWFLEHQESAKPAAGAALEAARRVLGRVVSTATAELALYVVGVAGSEGDIPLLRSFYGNSDGFNGPLHAASEASLARLGSQPHLETLRRALEQPVERGTSYQQTGLVARQLRTAALSGRQELIPAVCSHLSDPARRGVEYVVDPSRTAIAALSALVDGTSPAAANQSRRSRDEWIAYCRDLR